MQTTIATPRDPLVAPAHESAVSGVAWPAIFAGAFVAISISLILLILGSGLGFATMSPWTSAPSSVTVTSAVVSWLIIMQWISSGLGGYLAGRLRTKYGTLHTDEVFFRDTAHGFLAWAVATVATASIFASTVFSGLSGGAHIAGHMSPTPVMNGSDHPMNGNMGQQSDNNMYIIDTLFRSDHPALGTNDDQTRAETMRILFMGLKNGDVPQADKSYLSEVVAARAGIPPLEASKRVDDVILQMNQDKEKAKAAADTARKTAATLSIFTFLSLLVGAFVACVGAALGGKRRDEY